MEIESIPYSEFKTLTSCNHALEDPDNHGCQWYASTDRRVAGRIYLDPESDAFRFSVLRLLPTGWKAREPSYLFADFEEAESTLLTSMRQDCGGKEVSVKDVPMKLRFGRGAKKVRGYRKPE